MNSARATRSAGSSSIKRPSACESFASSSRCAGAIATAKSGSDSGTVGSSTFALGELSVSPVPTPSRRASATIAPGPADVTGSCFLPNKRAMPDKRTVALPRDAFTSGVVGDSVPVNTRTTESLPCCGCTMVLQTCATTGPSGRGTIGRPSVSLRGSVIGDGKRRAIASTSGATPTFSCALPTSTGMI